MTRTATPRYEGMYRTRPSSIAALNTIVEDMGERFDEEQQEAMMAVVAEVLGQFDPPDTADGADEDTVNGNGADAAMEEAES